MGAPIGDRNIDLSGLLGDLSVKPGQVEQVKGHSTKDTLGVSNKQNQSVNLPSNPGKPVLTLPKETRETIDKTLTTINTTLKENPWLQGSPLGVVLASYSAILSQFAEMGKMDRESKITAVSGSFDMKKDAAKLAKQNKESQATEEITKAVASFANATITFCEFAKTANNPNLAEERYNKEVSKYDTQIEAKKLEIADLQTPPGADSTYGEQIKAIDTNRDIQVDTGDIPMQQMGATTDVKNERDNWMKSDAGKAVFSQDAELTKLTNQKNDLETKKTDIIQRYKSELDQSTQAMTGILTRVTDGMASAMNAIQKNTQGELTYAETVLNAYASILDQFAQAKKENAGDASQALNTLLQAMQQMEDAAARLNRLSQA